MMNKVAGWVGMSIVAAVIYGLDLVIGLGTFFMTARETTLPNEVVWSLILLGDPIAFVLACFRPRMAACLLAGVAFLLGLIALYSCLAARGLGSIETLGEILWLAFAFWGPKFLLAFCFLQPRRAVVRVCGAASCLPRIPERCVGADSSSDPVLS